MTNNPIVSVIMPMFNAEAFVLAALSSIMGQCGIPLEIIVVNDGSTDASLDKVKSVAIDDNRVQVVQSPQRQSIATALNAGLAVAKGDIVMRCDADDLYPARRIAKQVEWLQRNTEFDAICSDYMAIDASGHPIITFNCGETAEEITQELRNGVTRTHFCTFAIRTPVLRKLGGFRHYFHTSEDIDLQLRLSESCRVWYTPDIYYHYRIHDASITHTCSDVERKFFENKAREFQRQRHVYGQDDLQQGHPPTPPNRVDAPPLTASEHLQNLLLGRAWKEHMRGRKLQAFYTGMRSLMLCPSNSTVWFSVMALVMKPAGKQF